MVTLEKIWPLIFIISEVTSFLHSSNVPKKSINHWGYKTRYCTITFKDMRTNVIQDKSLPMIYFVTSTYPRPEQMPELVALSHTLMHVPRITWIVADDKAQCSRRVSLLLHNTGVPFAHIATSKPKSSSGGWLARSNVLGIANRRAALIWIRKSESTGILYFGDDDNTYDLQLFEEIRKTKKISMFPVGLESLYAVTAPLVENGKVKAFFNPWPENPGKFQMYISGFAINTDHLRTISITLLIPVSISAITDSFVSLDGFVIDDIEPLADNCTKVLVWRTRTVKNPVRHLRANLKSVANSKYENLASLLRTLSESHVISISPNSGQIGTILLNNTVVDYLANL